MSDFVQYYIIMRHYEGKTQYLLEDEDYPRFTDVMWAGCLFDLGDLNDVKSRAEDYGGKVHRINFQIVGLMSTE